MKISTQAPHAYEPSASEPDSTLNFNEVLCKHVSQRLSSNDQIRTNINVDWDWVLLISNSKFCSCKRFQEIDRNACSSLFGRASYIYSLCKI